MTGVALLTGATGFVGRQVFLALIKRGVKVRVVVREGKRDLYANIEGIETVITTSDLFCENSVWWANVCKDIDTVIHVAWYAEPGKYLQSEKNNDCLVGTLQLAKGAAKAKVRRFVGIGTCFEYDFTNGILSINTPLQPLTPYARSKTEVFIALSNWFSSVNVEFTWCRLFYLYGEGEDPRRLVPYLHAKLAAGEIAELTKGNQIRDYLDVRDAGEMIVLAALSDVQGPINICSGIPLTVRQLSERIADEYGRRDLLRFGALPDNLLDPPCVLGVKGGIFCD